MKRRDTGILGERLARDFLVEKGYSILETNFRSPEGEVDIVAQDKDCLVFVEVRTKRSHSFGTPEESITPTKMEKLRIAAAYYRQLHDDSPSLCRIDVVAVELDNKNKPLRIAHIENAVGDE